MIYLLALTEWFEANPQSIKVYTRRQEMRSKTSITRQIKNCSTGKSKESISGRVDPFQMRGIPPFQQLNQWEKKLAANRNIEAGHHYMDTERGKFSYEDINHLAMQDYNVSLHTT